MSQPQFEPHQNILNAYDRLPLEIRAVRHTGEPIQEIPVKTSIRPLRQRLWLKLCLMGKPDDWRVFSPPVYNRLKLYKLHNTRARRAVGWLCTADYLLFFPINRLRNYLSGGL